MKPSALSATKPRISPLPLQPPSIDSSSLPILRMTSLVPSKKEDSTQHYFPHQPPDLAKLSDSPPSALSSASIPITPLTTAALHTAASSYFDAFHVLSFLPTCPLLTNRSRSQLFPTRFIFPAPFTCTPVQSGQGRRLHLTASAASASSVVDESARDVYYNY